MTHWITGPTGMALWLLIKFCIWVRITPRLPSSLASILRARTLVSFRVLFSATWISLIIMSTCFFFVCNKQLSGGKMAIQEYGI